MKLDPELSEMRDIARDFAKFPVVEANHVAMIETSVRVLTGVVPPQTKIGALLT